MFLFFIFLIGECTLLTKWHPTPVLLPGKSHGRRSLVGCSPWGREELDMTEWLHFHFSLFCIGEGNGNPLQCSCLENPRDGGAWLATIYGVAQSWTWLKRLSSSKVISTDLPAGSESKESTCNAGDPGLVPRWEDPLEKGMAIHSSFLGWRISWMEASGGIESMESQRDGHNWVTKTLVGASLVTQIVKNLPAMQRTQIRSLGREDPLQESVAIHSSILYWKIPWREEPGRL